MAVAVKRQEALAEPVVRIVPPETLHDALALVCAEGGAS
jgi:hypothetical protein